MIKSFALLTTLFVLSFGKTCTEDQKSLFTCAEDTHCSEWSDGCNNCDCNGCTRMLCGCYTDNSCLPKCLSNNSCESRTVSDETSSDLTRSYTDLNSPTLDTDLNSSTLLYSCIKKSLFDCPGEDTLCKNWSDGCNICRCDGENPTSCTEMYCDCYDDKSCVPSCLDNDRCTLKIPLGDTLLKLRRNWLPPLRRTLPLGSWSSIPRLLSAPTMKHARHGPTGATIVVLLKLMPMKHPVLECIVLATGITVAFRSAKTMRTVCQKWPEPFLR